MKDSSKKSFFFLGLGLGIIIVNLIYFFNPKVKEEELSNEAIIKRAEELGMVSVKDNIAIDDKEDKNKPEEKQVKKDKIEEKKDKSLEKIDNDIKDEENKDDIKKEKNNEKEKIYTINIESGDVVSDIADKLLDKGLIKDKKTFSEQVDKRKASKLMRIGEFEISTEDSMDDIIDKIANLR